MIDSNDLSIYYPENSGSEEYIEFPNAYTQFDTATRRWVSTLFNPSADATPERDSNQKCRFFNNCNVSTMNKTITIISFLYCMFPALFQAQTGTLQEMVADEESKKIGRA